MSTNKLLDHLQSELASNPQITTLRAAIKVMQPVELLL